MLDMFDIKMYRVSLKKDTLIMFSEKKFRNSNYFLMEYFSVYVHIISRNYRFLKCEYI